MGAVDGGGCEAVKHRSGARFAASPERNSELSRTHSIRCAWFSKYCPHTEPTVENCGSPSLGFGEPLDFSLSLPPRHSVAWPAAFQIMFKNNEEFSIFELLRDVFSKRFHAVFCAV
jgi:hypothetical protein